jgi:beta-lactam-binding protein with PASTA domain
MPRVLLVVVSVGFAVILVFLGIRQPARLPPPTALASATSIAEVRVPNFVGSPTSNVQTGSEFLALHIVFVVEKGRESRSLGGIVVGQSPPAGEQVARGALVRLQVETKTVVVPLLAGKTLDQVVIELSKVGLRLGIITAATLASALRAGAIISQSPIAGSESAAGGPVDVTVATPN